MKEFKIKVTPDQSKVVQEVMFGRGWRWLDGTKNILFTECPYLFIYKDKSITYSIRSYTYLHHHFPEITFDKFIELFALTDKWCIKRKNEKYTLDELVNNPNIVVFIDNKEDWNRLKRTGKFRMTDNYYGKYCYSLRNSNYSSSSSETDTGSYENVEIIKVNQILFDTMKKEIIGYRLLKDTPDVPKGFIGKITGANGDIVEFKTKDAFEHFALTDSSAYTVRFCEINTEWFEPVYAEEKKFKIAGRKVKFDFDKKEIKISSQRFTFGFLEELVSNPYILGINIAHHSKPVSVEYIKEIVEYIKDNEN